jgi:type IV pilus assembly protein PilE
MPGAVITKIASPLSRSARGFTLIELLIVLVVITLLAAVAYPNYQTYQQRTLRAQAQQMLLDLSIAQQQRLLQYGSYLFAEDAATLKDQLALAVPAAVEQSYTLAVSQRNASAQQSIASATPLVSGRMSGDEILSIDEQGNRLPVVLW